MKKLAGKVALVTGSGRGIGRAVAAKLAAEGAHVVINDLERDVAEEALAAIRGTGGQGEALIGSVSEPSFAARYVELAMSAFGGVDIVVNNAGYTDDATIQNMSDEQFDAMYEVHVRAPFRLLRAIAPIWREQSRRDSAAEQRIIRKVVNISSTSGTMGNIGQVNYSAAKAAVIGMTKTLAKEWGRYNATVNCVAFGYIQTRLTQAIEQDQSQMQILGKTIDIGMRSGTINALNSMIPLGRGGTAEEAAGAVYLFCIPESDYVSGQVLVCGGGFGSVA